jgi:hypothetical protein
LFINSAGEKEKFTSQKLLKLDEKQYIDVIENIKIKKNFFIISSCVKTNLV